MNLHSINDRVPEDAKQPLYLRISGAFIIAGLAKGVEIIFNSDGREVFRIYSCKQPWYKRLMFWQENAKYLSTIVLTGTGKR